MAKATRKPGRPPKPAQDRLEQFSIRLPAKLRFGLDLLARAQHRSLSQAIEWALKVGLNNYEVGNDFIRLGELVERAWSEDSEAGRLRKVFVHAPALLPFEDNIACEVVEKSRERLSAMDEGPSALSGLTAFQGKFNPIPLDRVAEFQSLMAKREQIQRELESLYDAFVAKYWEEIRSRAVDHSNLGKSTEEVSLLRLLDLNEPKAEWWDVMRIALGEEALDMARSKIQSAYSEPRTTKREAR